MNLDVLLFYIITHAGRLSGQFKIKKNDPFSRVREMAKPL